MNIKQKLPASIWLLMAVTFCLKLAIAGALEFSNDEVYYWLYAKYPALSHFDHPPMVGWVIQLFTLNLNLDSELFIRLPAIVFATVNMALIYAFTASHTTKSTGIIAAYLYTASIYCNIITGLTILPDSPQLFFWLLCLYFLSRSVLKDNSTIDWSKKIHFLLGALCAALAILSKYHGAFIVLGAGIYILLYNRKWLKQPVLYVGVIIASAGWLPIVIWNAQFDFISFTFHGNRVGFFEAGLRLDYFFTQIGGEMLYQNPVVYFSILLGIIHFFRNKNNWNSGFFSFLLCIALPLLAMFWFFSLFRSTLPHWTGPAFATLIPFGAYYLDQKKKESRLLPISLYVALAIEFTALGAAIGMINYGYFTPKNSDISAANLGENDPLLDMQGWKQVKVGVDSILQKEKTEKKTKHLLGFKWFPAAHIDYYVARPLELTLLVEGSLEQIHKYYWINTKRTPLQPGDNALYVDVSNFSRDPALVFKGKFEKTHVLDTIPIYRGDQMVRKAVVYKFEKYKEK